MNAQTPLDQWKAMARLENVAMRRSFGLNQTGTTATDQAVRQALELGATTVNEICKMTRFENSTVRLALKRMEDAGKTTRTPQGHAVPDLWALASAPPQRKGETG